MDIFIVDKSDMRIVGSGRVSLRHNLYPRSIAVGHPIRPMIIDPGEIRNRTTIYSWWIGLTGSFSIGIAAGNGGRFTINNSFSIDVEFSGSLAIRIGRDLFSLNHWNIATAFSKENIVDAGFISKSHLTISPNSVIIYKIMVSDKKIDILFINTYKKPLMINFIFPNYISNPKLMSKLGYLEDIEPKFNRVSVNTSEYSIGILRVEALKTLGRLRLKK